MTTVTCTRCGAVVQATAEISPVVWLFGHWESRHGGIPAVRAVKQ